MKVTKARLKQIIQEELKQYIQEQVPTPIGGELASYNVGNVKGVGDAAAGTIKLAVISPITKRGSKERDVWYDREQDAWVNSDGEPWHHLNQKDISQAYKTLRRELEASIKASGEEIKDPTWGLEYRKGL